MYLWHYTIVTLELSTLICKQREKPCMRINIPWSLLSLGNRMIQILAGKNFTSTWIFFKLFNIQIYPWYRTLVVKKQVKIWQILTNTYIRVFIVTYWKGLKWVQYGREGWRIGRRDRLVHFDGRVRNTPPDLNFPLLLCNLSEIIISQSVERFPIQIRPCTRIVQYDFWRILEILLVTHSVQRTDEFFNVLFFLIAYNMPVINEKRIIFVPTDHSLPHYSHIVEYIFSIFLGRENYLGWPWGLSFSIEANVENVE